MPDPRETVLAGLTTSSKYRHLAPAALERTADWALARHRKPGDALKAAKRKLHQGFGAYLDPGALEAVHRLLDQADETTDLRDLAMRILALHRSSAERLPVMDALYTTLWAETGIPEHILDVASGLNPFALHAMHLPPETTYTALEIDSRLVEAANRFLLLCNQPGQAFWTDIVSTPGNYGADVALVLKTLPCLEQEQTGAALDLLKALAGIPIIVVSYPVRSLGGREKGMRETYLEQITTLSAQISRTMTVLPIEDELVTILRHAPM
jgi:16S rRNA (guanine(1405)-N(7))-methyltransferase